MRENTGCLHLYARHHVPAIMSHHNHKNWTLVPCRLEALARELQLSPGKLADGRQRRGLVELQHFGSVWRKGEIRLWGNVDKVDDLLGRLHVSCGLFAHCCGFLCKKYLHFWHASCGIRMAQPIAGCSTRDTDALYSPEPFASTLAAHMCRAWADIGLRCKR